MSGRSLRDFNDNENAVNNDNRKGIENPDVESSLRDQIPKSLRKTLEERDISQQVVNHWDAHNANRAVQLDRQRKLLVELDEFIDPIYRKPQEWMSDLHLPLLYTICKTYHARMYSALMNPNPSFQVISEQEANTDRAPMVEQLMNYTIKRWANQYAGIENAVDDFIWSWITQGRGIWKLRWDKKFTRFVDVEEREVEGVTQIVDGQPVPTTETIEVPVKKDEKIFEGPLWEHVPQEDVAISGGDGDPDKADFVCHSIWMTPHELWTQVDAGTFDKDAVEQTIESGEDMPSGESANNIKSDRAHNSGENSPDSQAVTDRYQILEAYMKLDLDDSGIASDVIVWVHKDTRALLRATYLWRVNKSGTTPFAVADFYRRKGQESAVGLAELVYPLTKEIDAMHNMKIDFGILSSLPVGFYRASSSLSKERIPLTPGNLIPLDDPQRDINFPNLGNRAAFPAAEEASLIEMVSRVTGISDLQLGVLGSQGAARTATGARITAGESNANIDIFLRRLHRAYRKGLVYLFQMLRQRIPEGFEFRVTGDDGQNYYKIIETRSELQGMYDFQVDPVSANSNREIQTQNAVQIFNAVQNPLLIQLGIVTPGNIYEAAKNLFQQLGIKNWSRFINKPPRHQRIFMPEEIANRTLAGVNVPLTPEQDLPGFIAFVDELFANDESLGQFTEQEVLALAAKRQEARDMLQALEQISAQQANANQMQRNAALSAEQAAPGLTGGAQEALIQPIQQG